MTPLTMKNQTKHRMSWQAPPGRSRAAKAPPCRGATLRDSRLWSGVIVGLTLVCVCVAVVFLPRGSSAAGHFSSKGDLKSFGGGSGFEGRDVGESEYWDPTGPSFGGVRPSSSPEDDGLSKEKKSRWKRWWHNVRHPQKAMRARRKKQNARRTEKLQEKERARTQAREATRHSAEGEAGSGYSKFLVEPPPPKKKSKGSSGGGGGFSTTLVDFGHAAAGVLEAIASGL